MQPTKRLLTIIFPFLAFILFCGASFKSPDKTTVKKPCEATCQFSPGAFTTGFASCSFSNCNGSQSTTSVAAGTNWIPMLVGTGCTTVTIDVCLPNPHPGGTITIQRAGVTVATYVVAADADVCIHFPCRYECDDYYIVSFN